MNPPERPQTPSAPPVVGRDPREEERPLRGLWRPLRADERALLGLGSIKWVIIGSLVLAAAIAAWFALQWVTDFRDENCQAGEGWTACMVREGISGTLEVLKDAAIGATVGAGSTLFGWGKNIGEATATEAVSGKRWWNPWTWGT